jgi:[ribosomal protein S18]-alanine N-acetyltransferase
MTKYLQQFLLIDRECFSPPWNSENFLIDLPEKWDKSLGAFNNGLLVGYLIVSRKINHYHVHRIAVHPVFRHYGIGQRLLKDLMNYTAQVYDSLAMGFWVHLGCKIMAIKER